MPARRPSDEVVHPGLLLDKRHDLWPEGQDAQKDFVRQQLRRVTSAHGDSRILERALSRYRAAQPPGTVRWQARTAGPLSLHLSRASAFENVGLCLHPLYGFAYIPGSGLKGMARAYAQTVAKATAEQREAVFGKDTDAEREGKSGGVVFYDALPTRWPRLYVDIVNNHHRDYYEKASPPEDWEDPVPVNFLAVRRNATFEFAVAARHSEGDSDQLCQLARAWLEGALAWLGAGAKTNAGYGRFSVDSSPPFPEQAGWAGFQESLSLVTPAFLAGAHQQRADCDLRAATLRGLLRWWWRTLHAGFVSVQELQRLEGLLWGTTEHGGAISVEVFPPDNPLSVQQYDRDRIRKQCRLRKPWDRKTTQGAFYLAYGMEGNPKRRMPARWYAPEGSSWTVQVIARSLKIDSDMSWPPETVREQAEHALTMLSGFGGVGAKCRRGFGSVDAPSLRLSLPNDLYAMLRQAAQIRPDTRFSPANHHSPSAAALSVAEFSLGESNVWCGLDKLGAAYQSFASAQKHRWEKAALGLPRRGLNHPHGRDYSRHSSPLHFRLLNTPDGYRVRIAAFHDPYLPTSEGSGDYLRRCIVHIGRELGYDDAERCLVRIDPTELNP